MMKCDFCDRKATVFLTQLVEGKMKKICLCEPCSKERGVTDPTGLSLTNLFFEQFQQNTQLLPNFLFHHSQAKATSCEKCGFTLEDLKKIQRLGCPNCYQTFSEELAPLLQSMHKGVVHSGKIPEGLSKHHFRTKRLEELHEKLELAISEESYEVAARIRDEIHHLTQIEK